MALPVHVAFIMDGNGRWAKKRGLERIEGHKKGAEVADSASRWCADLGIRYVTLYAFS
ncbi:MAG TPA: isoprenyl transferase, partial [Mesotoga infera]|nr:isoprenyl transferase [Mesotoga infera]